MLENDYLLADSVEKIRFQTSKFENALFKQHMHVRQCNGQFFESLPFEVENIYVLLKEISTPLEMLCVNFTTAVLFT